MQTFWGEIEYNTRQVHLKHLIIDEKKSMELIAKQSSALGDGGASSMHQSEAGRCTASDTEQGLMASGDDSPYQKPKQLGNYITRLVDTAFITQGQNLDY
ncbi:hypothetical protein scyTo_0009229 [Scyliorhinus torazame]|uniref:Uncharacterized protein n=1 Tax=Scyliorhinus torazame TaxID=75743 RepID=A0A401NIR6_SCYTO|nr:hypothetical protein [Scyliorhinus torazame]